MSGPHLSTPSAAPRTSFRCDFCGAEVDSVRRVALDSGYDRLRVPHKERFACADCSERKERSRLGLR
jgi:DNA-directed RNA polymerase subunit RPC12/RpoP